MKKIILMLLVGVLFVLCLASCGGQGGDATYTVTVKDSFGNAPDKVIYVEIYKPAEDGTETFVKMLKANEQGVCSVTLPKASYTFKVSSADGEISYDTTICTLTDTVFEREITIYNTPQGGIDITVPTENGHEDIEAPMVTTGASYVMLDGNTYLIFVPQESGFYKFSCEGGTLEYRGGIHFVQSQHASGREEDGSFEIEVKDSGIGSGETGTTSFVLCVVPSEDSTSAIVTIERTRDATRDVPYDEITATEVSSEPYIYDLLNYMIKDLDIKDKNLTVVKGQDGYYHIGDENGPVVYIRISSASPYLASFKDICDRTSIACVEKDADGNITLKERYNELILAYAEKCDKAGICPLTDELKYVIEKASAYYGWFTGDNNIFKTYEEAPDGTVTEKPILGIVEENAWLFACCYIEKGIVGTESLPISIAPVTADDEGNMPVYGVLLDNEVAYFTTTAGGRLTIESTEGITLTYGGAVVEPTEGKIVLTISGADSFNISVTGNKTVTFTYEVTK
ncbi:MAG: hypothetical protein IJ309_01835 [Clostridia bacterium]|nr:hypothetical protein [Clostridia bacterium]